MKRVLTLALLLAPLPALAKPAALSSAQKDRVQCVAALAIIASEQERGAGDWSDYPNVGERGAKFSDVVRDELVKATGRTPDDVRGDILAAIEKLQKQAMDASDPETLVFSIADRCVAMMNASVPPPPKPSLLYCAIVVRLAQEEVKSREGMSRTAQELLIFASALENKTRDQLRAEGKTDAEGDIVIGLERERLVAEFKAKPPGGSDNIDFQSCFDMAKPDAKP